MWGAAPPNVVPVGGRVGIGFDVHPFTDDPVRPLVLGGVELPGEQGLAGHSDADVVAHAVADALLGAAGLGDLGEHFPADDAQWAGADSLGLLIWLATLALVLSLGLRSGLFELRYLVLPERPAGTEQLSETELADLVTRDSMIGVAVVRPPRAEVGAASRRGAGAE